MKKKTNPIKITVLIVEKISKKKRDIQISIRLMDFQIKMALKQPLTNL